ncbi:hypothetical protein GQ607_007556 [Colletotrichum asianum]|uniref:Uncharacterized protein n=1 Tax=Colletotrichum asianum TaxID=702518 RepID=A0A8H3WE57_9PEZI|nr:hypothetical protein GQ607_007556 [Colletotrichum asianum]
MSSSASNLPVARSEAAETKRDKRTAQPQHLTGQPPDPAPSRSKLDASSLRFLHQHQPIHQCPRRHAPLSRPCLCLTRTDVFFSLSLVLKWGSRACPGPLQLNRTETHTSRASSKAPPFSSKMIHSASES